MRSFIVLILAVLSVPAAALAPLSPTETARVEALLSRMTLEEKAGEMTQLTLSYFLKGRPESDGRKDVDLAKLEDAIVAHHVGSILNVGDDRAYSPERWRRVLTSIQDIATKKTRLRIPVLYGIDAMHGANYSENAVLFPKQLSLAAARDEEGTREAYELTALQVRATGVPWDFAPVLDVGRQPLWPRFDETFGEDPYLVTRLGAAAVRGLQGSDPSKPDRVAASLKHYVGYSFPWTGRDRTPANMGERALREIFLPSFAAAVREGALTVMVNSAEIDGIPGHADRHLLTDVLKGELGFEGFAVSDWEDVRRLHERDHVAATPEDAVALAVNAGVDMSMVPDSLEFTRLLIKAVTDGKVPLSRVDDAVRRILRVKARLGLFARPYPVATMPARLQGPQAARLSRRLAEESLVLLQNDGLLPLKTGAKLFVVGPAADSRQALNGSWSVTWQGDDEAAYPKWRTILEAVRARFGAERVGYLPASGFSAGSPADAQAAVSAARGADAVVAVLGEKAYAETPGNIDDLTLDAPQRELLGALEQAGLPVILVLAEGRPRTLGGLAAKARAVLFAGRPGPYGGEAVASVLSGAVNPSGRLPFSYPRSPNALLTYDRKPMEDTGPSKYDPLYPFGAGLSYTRFRYDDLRVAPASLRGGERAEVSLRVTNTGARAGADVVELYLSQKYASVSPAVRRLKGFQRVTLEPGGSQTVSFVLGGDELSVVGADMKRKAEPGEYEIVVGTCAVRLKLQ